MRYRYYPGCTLKGKAVVMEETALASAEKLGLQLSELEEWQCCGAVFPLSEDEIITLLSPARTIAAAEGEPLVTLCSACHHVLRRTQDRLQNDKDALGKINNFLEMEYTGESRVMHFLELLKEDVGFHRLAEKVTNPLKGRKVAAYYGCLLLRPAAAMQFDDPENPRIMEDFIRALGAEPVMYPYRTECCGGYLSVTDKNVADDTTKRVCASASRAGARIIATACPLCVYNLKKVCEQENTSERTEVVYFTELLAEALGVERAAEVSEA